MASLPMQEGGAAAGPGSMLEALVTLLQENRILTETAAENRQVGALSDHTHSILCD
jgi:hypothetical protein